ncbi:MAG: cob(I)yrinic acid a,c-diamide adenosyltransferase [Bacteroidales bacterium]|nr:cob(I)yrinic acid a,c-diamide adenosyltransferase [Bacteroidales bacterium]
MATYTKTGDNGTTSLVGGTRVKKYDVRVKAYGEIDSLVSLMGYIGTLLKNDEYKNAFFVIQDKLFICESIVACEKAEILEKMDSILDSDISYLEKKIDAMEEELPRLKSFIIPSSSQSACLVHMARTLCRKCERLCVECSDKYGLDANVLKYLNRLSDYFFVLSRKIMQDKHRTERYWKSRM